MSWLRFGSLVASSACLVAGLLLASGCSEDGASTRRWAEPQEVDPNPPAIYPALVAGPDGRDLAVWRGPNPDPNPTAPEGFDGIYASWKSAGGSWGAATVVDDFLAFPFPPSAAAGPSGEAIVVWGQAAGRMEPDEVLASIDGGDGTWGDPVLVGEAGFSLRESPLVAIGPSGRAFATWWLVDTDEYSIALSELQADGSWGPRVLEPVAPRSGSVSALGMSVDRTGRVVFVWWEVATGTSVNRFDPDRGWAAATSINDEALPGPPVVDIDPEGTVFAFWPAREDLRRCSGASRNTSGGWDEPTRFDTDCSRGNTGTVSADGAGGATAVWGLGFSDQAVAFWSRYDSASGWSEAQPAPVGEGTGPLFWGLSARASGDTVAMWYRSAVMEGSEFGGRLDVWTSLLDRAGTWSEPERLAEQGPRLPATNGTFVPPRVVSHSDGRAVGVWLLTANPDDSSGLFNTLWSSDYR